MTMIAVRYRAAPGIKHGGFRRIAPGDVRALLVRVIASADSASHTSPTSRRTAERTAFSPE
jgi:hypothetical protein